MTRTEEQLRAALTQLAGVADAPVAAGAAVSHRRRTGWVLAVAGVLVVAVAVVALAVVRTGSDRSAGPLGPTGSAVVSSVPATTSAPPTASGPAPASRVDSPALYEGFFLDPASGYTLAGRRNTPTEQSGYVLLPDRPKAEIDVSLYAAGAFDPTSATTGTPISVGGVAGWRGPVVDPTSTLSFTSDVWEYAPGAWAVVTDRSGLTDGATAAEELAVAEAVRVASPPADLPVPFTIGALPAGLTVDVVLTEVGTGSPSASVGFGDDLAGDPKRASGDGGAITVAFGSRTAAPTGAPTVQVDGRPGWLSMPLATHTDANGQPVSVPGRLLTVDYGAGAGYGVFYVEPSHVDRYDDAVLTALAAATTPVANLTDVSSWVPAASGALG